MSWKDRFKFRRRGSTSAVEEPPAAATAVPDEQLVQAYEDMIYRRLLTPDPKYPKVNFLDELKHDAAVKMRTLRDIDSTVPDIFEAQLVDASIKRMAKNSIRFRAPRESFLDGLYAKDVAGIVSGYLDTELIEAARKGQAFPGHQKTLDQRALWVARQLQGQGEHAFGTDYMRKLHTDVVTAAKDAGQDTHMTDNLAWQVTREGIRKFVLAESPDISHQAALRPDAWKTQWDDLVASNPTPPELYDMVRHVVAKEAQETIELLKKRTEPGKETGR